MLSNCRLLFVACEFFPSNAVDGFFREWRTLARLPMSTDGMSIAARTPSHGGWLLVGSRFIALHCAVTSRLPESMATGVRGCTRSLKSLPECAYQKMLAGRYLPSGSAHSASVRDVVDSSKRVFQAVIFFASHHLLALCGNGYSAPGLWRKGLVQ